MLTLIQFFEYLSMNPDLNNSAQVSTLDPFAKVTTAQGTALQLSGHNLGVLDASTELQTNDGSSFLSTPLLSNRSILIILVLSLALSVLLLIQAPIPAFQPQHDGLTFGYPTLGIPIPGQTYNNTYVSFKDLRDFDRQINQLFKPYNDTDCEFGHYGNENDGGYIICKNFIEQAEGLINIGISSHDDFGCEMTAVHPMPNYQYDCTSTFHPQCSTNNNKNQYFDMCLGAKSQKIKTHTFSTLQDIIKSHNLQTKHLLLKIDCQGGQYFGLKYFPTKYLDQIDQLIMQLHFGSVQEQWGILDILKTIDQHFISVNLHFNNWVCFGGYKQYFRSFPAQALEVVLVNKKLIKLKSQTRSYKLLPWNKPSAAERLDCQLHD